jgi:hypothetical protein
VEGTTGLLADDDGPVPTALVAVTVKVYEVPLSSPRTMQLIVPLVRQVWPPLDVTV